MLVGAKTVRYIERTYQPDHYRTNGKQPVFGRRNVMKVNFYWRFASILDTLLTGTGGNKFADIEGGSLTDRL